MVLLPRGLLSFGCRPATDRILFLCGPNGGVELCHHIFSLSPLFALADDTVAVENRAISVPRERAVLRVAVAFFRPCRNGARRRKKAL
jgi:hypothetical protein